MELREPVCHVRGRDGEEKDVRKPSRQIDLPQFIVEPSGIHLSTNTRRHARNEIRVAIALDFDRTPHIRRRGVVPECTSVRGPDKEGTAAGLPNRTRGHRSLRGLMLGAAKGRYGRQIFTDWLPST